MSKVLEAVPNFSEGRDLEKIGQIVDRIRAYDVDVLDWSADPDHNRSVVTLIGAPADVVLAALGGAECAVEVIDLREHEGVHPRVGALDVLPFVPLGRAEMSDAISAAREAARAVAGLGVPVYLYGKAAAGPGRDLASLRRGGYERLRLGWPEGRVPDDPAGRTEAHPTAGVACIGARDVLLAWNVVVRGIPLGRVREIAASLRERGGGFAGLRALGLHLERQRRLQVSMNLEDPIRTSPMSVFEAIRDEVTASGGEIVETEVIGMIPDTLVQPGSAGTLNLLDLRASRVLSHRVAEYLSRRPGPPTEIPDFTE
jgi:glutamate formiminotransferase